MFTKSNWEALLAAWKKGELCEIGEDVYDYFLEVLPPVSMRRTLRTINGQEVRSDFEFAEGAERTTLFWRQEGKFYLQHSNRMNPRA